MYSHGKLPPLQSIGRTTTFDDGDTLVYFDALSDVGTESEHSLPSELEEPIYGLPEAELTARLLYRNFRIYEPGSHVCKKAPAHGGSSFVHCTNGMSLARQYAQLNHLLEEHALLEFIRDYVFRIKSITTFVKDLESLVSSEYQTWHTVMHNNLTEAPKSQLYCLTTVCEDLRIHVNHWNCIKQRWHTERWLKTAHKDLCFQLELVKKTLFKVRDAAIWWIERLIKIGLEVFANSDPESITHDMLWNICRGLEEFNAIVNTVRSSTTSSGSKFMLPVSYKEQESARLLSPLSTNSVAQMACSFRPIPFVKLLGIIANERAQYAALKAHRFFTTSDRLVVLLHKTRLPKIPWLCQNGKDIGTRLGPVSSGSFDHQDTSDYYTASNVSSVLGNRGDRFGVAHALVSAVSPLVDFAEQEQDFIGHVLNVACTSTNLLRKNGPSHVRGSGKSTGYRSPSRPPRGPVDESSLIRSDLKRKCVSWGDSADTSVRVQVASKYMETLWQSFGNHLELTFQDAIWGLDEDYVDTELGSLTLCDDVAVMILQQIIQFSCLNDLFPSGSKAALMSVRRSLHLSAAVAAWQTELSRALGSSISDKCYPCPLVGGDCSTQTGRQLRDTFQPLLSALTDQSTADLVLGKGSVPKPSPDLSAVVELASRLLVTGSLAHHWCYTKTHQFLASWSVGSFLLVSQTDLKMLADETKHGVWLTQTLLNMLIVGSGNLSENPMVQELSGINQQLQDISGQLQTLAGAAVKLFGERCSSKSTKLLQDTMPLGKIWRKKVIQDVSHEHSPYVEQLLDCVMDPTVEGVSKLKVTSQLGVISVATVAMCDAWTEFILKEKIKFSVDGASLLAVDFGFVRSWLCQFISNEDVRQSVLELGIFRKLNGIVQLLMKQSKKKSRDTCSVDDVNGGHGVQTENIGGSADTVSYSTGKLEGCITAGGSPNESDINHVQNIEAWLALRLYSPARWKLSSCFAGQPSDI